MGPEGMVAVSSRIRVIQSMVGASAGSGEVTFDLTGATTDAGADPDFEPFGAVYEAALATATVAQPTASTLPSTYGQMLDSIGPRALGIGATAVGTGSLVASMGPAMPPVGSVTGTSSGASIGRIGGYGRLAPPADLAPYGNGRIPAAALEPIGQGGHRLSAPAARAWRACVEAARADGIDLTITDSYRSYDQQVDLVQRKGLYSNGGYGATPGSSNHGWGMAVDADVTAPATLSWMRNNAWQYGFVEAVPREPWHWEFRPNQA